MEDEKSSLDKHVEECSSSQENDSKLEDRTEKGTRGDRTSTDVCDSPREAIKKKFLVEMPEDFYEFWEFAKSLNSAAPSGLLRGIFGF